MPKSAVGHFNRKNPKSRDAYEKEKHEKNAARPIQIFDPILKIWIRRA